MELVALNNLPETSQNGFNYSSLDGKINPEGKRIDQGEETEDDDANDTLTDFQGFMLLLTSYIGIGFLGIPYMVKLLGLWGGSGGIFFYGILNEFGALVLARSTQRLTDRTGERFGDIGSVSEMSMKVGPPYLQPHARKFRIVIDFCILATYFLFLTDLMSLMNLFGKDVLHQYIDIGDTLSIVVISVLLLPVYVTRRMRLLSFIAAVGNTVLFGIFIITFQYICRDLPDISTRSPAKFVDYLTFTSFANDVMFSCGGIVMILPIRNRMQNKKNFDGWNGLLGIVLVLVTSVHVSCGFFGYLKFGDMIQVNVLLSLPGNSWIYKLLKILSFLSLYCTMGMPVFILIEMIWPPLKERLSMEPIQNYGEYICRVILLILVCTVTILVPEFELLMSLTGCLGVMFTTLPLPYIITILILFGETEPRSLIDKVKRKLLLICCAVNILFGIYSTVSGIGVAVYMTLFHIIL